eukprot:12482852-Heterocapsa_arctica.AAC.1
MAAVTAILEHAGTRPRRRGTTTCVPCVAGRVRPQPVDASVEQISIVSDDEMGRDMTDITVAKNC